MKTISLISLSLLSGLSFLGAETLTFDFKDPKGVNNAVFQMDAPLESINGTANGVSGTVEADPKDPSTVKGTIVIAADSLSVPNPMMKEHMLSAGWIDAKTYPEIKFELTKVTEIAANGNKGTATATGKFTLKGVTKEITVPVNVTYLPGKLKDRVPNLEGDLLVIRSKFTIKRGDFGIKAGEALDKVSDDIEITLSVAGAAKK